MHIIFIIYKELLLHCINIAKGTQIGILGECKNSNSNNDPTCVSGLDCFKKNSGYSFCLTNCPDSWDCAKDKTKSTKQTQTRPTSKYLKKFNYFKKNILIFNLFSL